MKKSYDITANSRIEIFQYWLAAINWTLGSNSLTEAELKILSYFLYYNDKYKSIPEEDTRNELLFSTSVKKKIREEFNIDSQKLETYLNKLRKKGIITSSNAIDTRFIIYPEKEIVVSLSILHKTISSPLVNTQVPEPINEIVLPEVTTDSTEEPIIEELVSVNLWDKYMNDGEKPKVSNWNDDEE